MDIALMKRPFTKLNTISGHLTLTPAVQPTSCHIMPFPWHPTNYAPHCQTHTKLRTTICWQKHLHPSNCCTPQFNLTQGTADHTEHNSTCNVPLVQQPLPYCRQQNATAKCSLLCWKTAILLYIPGC